MPIRRPIRGGKRDFHFKGRGGRGGGGGPPGKRFKREHDPGKYAKKKYNENKYVLDEKQLAAQAESSSESSSDDEKTEYNQLVEVFNTKGNDDEKVMTNSEGEYSSDQEEVGEEEEGSEVDDSDQGEDEQLEEPDDMLEMGEEEGSLLGEEEESEGDDNGEEGSENDGIEEGEDGDNEEIEDDASEVDEEGNEDLIEDENEKEDKIVDPFAAHFEVSLSEDICKIVKEQKYEITSSSLPCLGKVQISRLSVTEKSSSPLAEALRPREANQLSLMTSLPHPDVQLQDMFIKQKILNNFVNSADPNIAETKLTTELLSIFTSYKDFMWSERNSQNKEEIRLAYSCHALNHAMKTRSKIMRHDSNLKQNVAKIIEIKRQTRDKDKRKELLQDMEELEYKDQGLTRPTVLIVVPFKESARKIIHLMGELVGGMLNSKRFMEEFREPQKVDDGPKPDDHYETFEGDTDDSFKTGIAVNRASIRPFSEFSKCDIIVATPLALRMIIGRPGDRERNYDFLSSIEVMIIDEMETLMMQNWDHVNTTLDHIHKKPEKAENTDFSRVKLYVLDGLTQYYRQTLLFSGTQFPEMNGVFNRNCHNYFGKVRVVNPVISGSISTIFSEVPIVFQRIATTSPKEALEDRFTVLQKLIDSNFMKDSMDHVMVFFSDYVDFVKARNWFKSSNKDYGEVCEYTPYFKVKKNRDEFYHNNLRFLLYTERAHFFRRYTIKGIRHLIFYQMPLNPHFFSEICNLQQDEFQNARGGYKCNMSCTVLYTKYDACRLINTVGTEKAGMMIKADNEKHVFSSMK